MTEQRRDLTCARRSTGSDGHARGRRSAGNAAHARGRRSGGSARKGRRSGNFNVASILSLSCFRKGQLKEHVVPPCLVLVIDDNLYGLMVALSYI